LDTVLPLGVANLEVRVPIASKKIRVDEAQIKNLKETVTGHYMRFAHKIMIEMDKFPAMKGCYIIMDNAHIHTFNAIEKMIISRGYRCIYLPPYSHELNSIEQF
jgi:transposase